MATHPQPPLPPGGRCYCASCRSRGLMGPAVLITLGILFMLGEFHVASFGRTWPILLIVIGLVKVLSSSASKEGHMDEGHVDAPPPVQSWPAASGAPPAPPASGDPGKVDHV